MKFGYQSVRWGFGRAADIFPQILDEVSAAGFEAVEVNDADVIPHLNNAHALSKMMSEKGVRCEGLVTYIIKPLLLSDLNPYNFVTWRQIKKLMKFAHILGCEKFVLAAPITPSARLGVKEKEYTKLSKVLTKIGKECKKLQMDATYHPKVESIGTTMEQNARLLEMTDPELLNLTLDTGHLSISGLDPLDIIRAFPDRIDHVHLKDVKAGVFAELGEGTDIDVRAIMQSLRSIGYDGWVIVEDEVEAKPPLLSIIGKSTKSPLETAKNSKEYLVALMKSI